MAAASEKERVPLSWLRFPFSEIYDKNLSVLFFKCNLSVAFWLHIYIESTHISIGLCSSTDVMIFCLYIYEQFMSLIVLKITEVLI